jgi:hypothetical protein
VEAVLKTRSFLKQDLATWRAQQAALKEVAAENEALGVPDPAKRRAELLETVGLSALKTPDTDPKLALAEACFPQWTEQEEALWRQYLSADVRLENYQEEQPPDGALEAIAAAKQLDSFRKFWVLSGKSQYMVVGEWAKNSRKDAETRLFPIAQWGEKLSTLQDIRRRNRRPKILGSLAAVIAVVGIVFAIVFFAGRSSNEPAIGEQSQPTTSSSAPAPESSQSQPKTHTVQQPADTDKPGYVGEYATQPQTPLEDAVTRPVGALLGLFPYFFIAFLLLGLVSLVFRRR